MRVVRTTRSASPPAATSLGLLLAVLLVVSFGLQVSAKRGCSAFGHSCYGGHGKRSESDLTMEIDPSTKEVPQPDNDISSNDNNNNNIIARHNAEQEALMRLVQLLIRKDQRFTSLRERLSPTSWSLLISKLMALSQQQYSNNQSPY